ncbi:MAG: helix-turn-helix domain-containing protein [Candidatus Woesearchaeota archaeon]
MEQILKELGKNFNLHGKELLILQELIRKPMNADELSNNTNIPKGRIYEHLNELIAKKLIDKSEKKPYTYTIENFEQNIAEFLKQTFENMVQKQHSIMHLIEQKKSKIDEIISIDTSEDYSFRTIQILKESRFLKNIIRHGSIPFVLYPKKSSSFSKVRSLYIENRPTLSNTTVEMTFMIYHAYEDAYEKKKPMEYIVEEEALNIHRKIMIEKMGEKFFAQMIQEVKERLKQSSIRVYVAKEFIPMQILISDKKVFLALTHHSHTKGLILMNPSAVEIYEQYFDNIKKRCTRIEDFKDWN